MLQITFTPILTRVYSPEAFGLYTLFISLFSILNATTSLKYELALPLTNEENKNLLLKVNIILGFLISLIIGGLLFIFDLFNLYSFIEGIENLQEIWYYIPVSLFAFCIFTNTNYYLIKNKSYKTIASINVLNSLFKVSSQISIGVISSLGLIMGDVISKVIIMFLALLLVIRKPLWIRNLSKSSVKNLLKTYIKFPLYTLPASLLNSISTHITPMLIIIAFGPVVGGFYALTHRVLAIPIAFVGTSISQVYLSKAPELYKTNRKALKDLYLKVAKSLLLFSIPIVIIAYFGSDIFSFVFGPQWSEAGKYLKALIYLYVAQVVVVPLSQTLNIIEKNEIQLFWDLIRLSTTLFIFLGVANYLDLNPIEALEIYSIAMFALYVVLFFTTLQILKNLVKKDEAHENS